VPFAVILLIVLGFILVISDPPIVLFLLFVAYGLSGYVYWLWKKRRRGEPAPCCSSPGNPLYCAHAFRTIALSVTLGGPLLAVCCCASRAHNPKPNSGRSRSRRKQAPRMLSRFHPGAAP